MRVMHVCSYVTAENPAGDTVAKEAADISSKVVGRFLGCKELSDPK